VSHRYEDAAAVRRFVRRIAATRAGSWVFARAAHRLDRIVYRATGGRSTLASWISGLPPMSSGRRRGASRSSA
jgi:hypothetical protein